MNGLKPLRFAMNVKKRMIRFNMVECVHIARVSIQFYYKAMSVSLRKLRLNKSLKGAFFDFY